MFYKFCRALKKNQKGFTLVELMVVLIIIGVLVAIAVPVYRNVTTDAEANACKASQRTIEGAFLIYRADQSPGDWPKDYVVGVTAAGDLKNLCPTKKLEFTPATGVASCEDHPR